MIKNILGYGFKYEDDKLYKYTNKCLCCNDFKGAKKGGYILVCIKNKRYLLHRLVYKYHNEDWDITDTSNNNLIDHIDMDPTNNKIENLRIVNKSQNSRNRKKKENCNSEYIGVNKNGNKWQTKIKINGKQKHLGLFNTEEEAAEAYKTKFNELMNL